MNTWRDDCAPIIAEVIERVGRDDMKALRKELRAAFPYGERARWPYKVWLDEIRTQLGMKKRKDSAGIQEPPRHEDLPGQLHLFGE